MNASTRTATDRPCGCDTAPPDPVGERPREEQVTERAANANLEDLVPIAVVIAAGCVPCARRMVERALSQGSPTRHIRKTLGIVAHMQRQDCLLQAVGPEAARRMDGPLAMARTTLTEHAAPRHGD